MKTGKSIKKALNFSSYYHNYIGMIQKHSERKWKSAIVLRVHANIFIPRLNESEIIFQRTK